MTWNRMWPALALAIAVAVAGCGGGGGGSSTPAGAGGSGTSTPGQPGMTSGLVPVAPALGATLYADAAPLRVLRAGAVWTYHGIDKPAGESASEFKAYTNTVTHATVGNGIVEQGTQPFNSDPESNPIRYEGGSYISTNQIAFSDKTPAQAINVIELRSPVKVNDQYVSLDKHIADSGADLDGDNVNDALDVAIYSTVIGEEAVDLPNRRQVKAVRVDMHLRARATLSKTGTTSPVYDAVQSTWYAPGVGVVKTRVDEPNHIASLPNHVVTEILENWDGVTEGLGHTATVSADASPDSAPLQYFLGAVGFDTHAVAVGYIPGEPQAAGLAVAQIDAHGNVVAKRRYTSAELLPSMLYMADPHVLRVGNEVRIFGLVNGQQLWMVSLDSTGQNILRPAVQLVSDLQAAYVASGVYNVASDDAGIWVGWGRAVDSSHRALLAQHFDANGQAPGAVNTVEEQSMGDIFTFSMALDGSRLTFAWITSIDGSSWHVATLDTATGTHLSDQTLGLSLADCRVVQPVALRPGLAITCSALSGIGVAPLDANGNPVLSSGASLKTNGLQTPWLGRTAGGVGQFDGSGGRLIVNIRQLDKFWPEDGTESSFVTVFETSGSAALVDSEPVLLARIAPFVNVQASVKLGNRLLLIGSDSAGYINTTVVWLPI
ncbi:MAG: hypothetical protein JF619_10705 [Massilia sp.]|nr:hypothetical protein [Massilia sp.]